MATQPKSAARVTSPVILSPEGGYIEVTVELYDAVRDFVESKRTGSVRIDFRDGGFAQVEGNYKKSYPRQKSVTHEKLS